MSPSADLRQRLDDAIQALPAIDTHEHIPDESTLARDRLGFFSFFDHYVSSDLVSAGMPRETLNVIRDPSNGLGTEGRWSLIDPFWPHARTTGYGRAMLEYMRDLFGVEDINGETVVELDRRIREAHQPGWYHTVLREKANIDKALVIIWPGGSVDVDQELFRAVPILDHYAIAGTRTELSALEKQSNASIQTLDQLLAAQEAKLDEFTGKGIIAVKIFLAYRRPLFFERIPKATAARAFDRLWLSQTQDLAFDDLKPLQDFMTRNLVGLAADRRLPIQIHTGMQEGNGNYLENSNPLHLSNLFMEFGDARFDIFHAGYPFTSEVAVLAKNFPNVYADLCWVHAISPTVAIRTLHEWLETIPTNKIFAFGGDSNYVEGAYGHGKVARRIVQQVLTEKVESGYLSEDEALSAACRLLRENAAGLFGLSSEPVQPA